METKTKNKHETALWTEIFAAIPDEQVIRDCVANGADISGGFLYYLILFDACCPKQVEKQGEGVKLKELKLLIELGADVKWQDNGGFDCLFGAILSWVPELVELVLQAGANPNCTQDEETILAYAATEYSHAYYEAQEELEQIMQLLEKYGAKYEIEDIQLTAHARND